MPADPASMLPLLDDAEGAAVHPSLPPVIDAHVHLFPDRLFAAIQRWFNKNAWPIRYPLNSEGVLDFLFERGIRHVVALHYAHKPAMARDLNRYLADLCRREPRVTGLATVLPGEPGAKEILAEAFRSGLKGVKLHCHVQCFAPDADALDDVYRSCIDHDLPLVMHAGREPASAAYACDVHALCNVERVERVLQRYPALRLCIPHFGVDEMDGYRRLLDHHDNLWLDTTMILADYFPVADPRPLVAARPERIMYGTDFPHIPYAWDRELRHLRDYGLSGEALHQVLHGTAERFFRITLPSSEGV